MVATRLAHHGPGVRLLLHGDPTKCPPDPHQLAIHTYTIVDAISDKNVLPFRIDYVNTIKLPDSVR